MTASEQAFSELPFFVSSDIPPRRLFYGFFDREADVSGNCEALKNAAANFVPEPSIRLLKQVHGTDVVEVLSEEDVQRKEVPEADGWLLSASVIKLHPNLFFGVKTADCFPVIVMSEGEELIAALHCGWRGTVSGILPYTLKRMLELGLNRESLKVVIGPGAGPKSYQITQEIVPKIKEALSELRSDSESLVIHRINDELYLDIGALLGLQAESFGVPSSQISTLNICTIESDRFFSYRREKSQTGRQVSLISGLRASTFVV